MCDSLEHIHPKWVKWSEHNILDEDSQQINNVKFIGFLLFGEFWFSGQIVGYLGNQF